MIKTRIEPEANYRAIWCNGKTLRFAIDPKKPITELKYPEFFDIMTTSCCSGFCKECYMDSFPQPHYENIIEKTRTFFDNIPKEHLPFQVALGGGEPTSHPDFIELLRVLKEEYDICPNYTTNGMFCDYKEAISSQNEIDILEATKKYCGGVAVSCHPHLKDYWERAAKQFIHYGIKLNFHIIISDRESIDNFVEIYNEWKDRVDYFVLLPYGVQGRAKQKEIDWEYLVEQLPEEQSKIAFGANFYPYLLKGGHNIKVCLYEPEIMSKFLDLKDMKLYPSSFNLTEIKQ
jgi:pyruvate-formate lyase-activating enzyme